MVVVADLVRLLHSGMASNVSILGPGVTPWASFKNSTCPENVIFHFIVSSRDVELESLVQITFPFLRLKLYHFDEELVKTRISSSVRSALEQPLNYARNYLTDMLESCVERVVYLDLDVIVVDEIAKLWDILVDRSVSRGEFLEKIREKDAILNDLRAKQEEQRNVLAKIKEKDASQQLDILARRPRLSMIPESPLGFHSQPGTPRGLCKLDGPVPPLPLSMGSSSPAYVAAI